MNTSRSLFSAKLAAVIFLIALMGACASPSVLRHPTTSATLWTQHAAEYRALTTSVYQTATSRLGLALEDSYWTAYPKQENERFRERPPAIILDVDETVLDNSPFQARMIKQNKSFDPEQWNNWVMEARANAVPGALAFTKLAADKGVVIFYLTNREAKVEKGTRKNLRKLGFPLSKKEDRILSKNERENWTSAKTERREFVGDRYRILMLFGDNLNDFISAKDISRQKRHQLVEQHQNKWGRKWYILPNPVYGSWESALYNFNKSLSPNQIDSVKKSLLDTKSRPRP